MTVSLAQMNHNKSNAFDLHSLSVFLPCGVDDITEEDIEQSGLLKTGSPLPEDEFMARHTADVHDDDQDPEEEYDDEQELKDESSEIQKKLFESISQSLAQKLQGLAPWLDVPLITEPEPDNLAHRSQNSNVICQPRVFFLQERIYSDWIERDGMNHWFHWRKNKPREPKADGRSHFQWHEVYYCHRGGKPEMKPQDPNAKRREVFKDKLKMGCCAALYVHKFRPGVHPALNHKDGDKLVRITYYPEHNHSLGDPTEFQHQRISDGLKERIRYYVSIGLGSRQIRERLTLPIEKLHDRLAMGTLTRDDFVTADDVGNVVNAYWKEKAELDKSIHKSLCSWMDRLASKNFFVFRAQDGEVVEKLKDKWDVAIGFASPWQLEKLRRSSDAIGLDSTHGTIRFRRGQGKHAVIGKFELFTVIVQDPYTMRGVPAAFLLTTNLTASPIELWLSALGKVAGPFRYITTDDSSTERLAIKNAFGGSVKIYLCLWHIARAWSQKIQSTVRGQTQDESKELRKRARQDLLSIMYENDLFQARNLIQKFRQDWKDPFPDLHEYVEKNYFNSEDRMRTWMKAYRQDEFYAEMDTNNFVESWHNHLKTHFLKRHFMVRADRMVYLLSEIVVNYFKQEEFQAFVRVGRKTKGEILDIFRQREVRAMSDDTIREHSLHLDNKYCVKSFSNPMAFYDVNVDSEGLMTECSCPYFLRLRRVCKHLLVLARRFPGTLRLPELNIFRFPSMGDALPEGDGGMNALPEQLEVTDEERAQEALNEKVAADMEACMRYIRAGDCDVKMLELIGAALEHAKTLVPLPDEHPNAKRQRQVPMKRKA